MEEEKQAREEAAAEAVQSKKLPAGTCKATNPELKARGDAKAQQHWDNWCDENCVSEKWGPSLNPLAPHPHPHLTLTLT